MNWLLFLGILLSLDQAALGQSLPKRPKKALTGTQFIAATANLSAQEREKAIYNAIAQGNVPNFLRKADHEVNVQMVDPQGHTINGVIRVSAGYLAIGSDSNYVTIPMSFHTATGLARQFKFSIPTRAMVNAIAKEATLIPIVSLPSNQDMTSNSVILHHQQLIKAALSKYPQGTLEEGFKKNIVLSNRLLQNPNALPIYGWFRDRERVVQPLSLVHSANYVDYSHGVRMVSEVMYVEGQAKSLYDIARHPVYHKLLSDEGPILLKALLNIDSPGA